VEQFPEDRLQIKESKGEVASGKKLFDSVKAFSSVEAIAVELSHKEVQRFK